jgi:hypothetical protein
MDVDTQNTYPLNRLRFLKIPVNPPSLKSPEPAFNALGLPIKDYYTTQDLCKILNISPYTLRYRLKAGHYPSPMREGGKSIFTDNEIREIIKITRDLIKKEVFLAGRSNSS